MNRLLAINAFVRVAEQESFTAAAKTLELSVSAVTRLVARLEHDLGARLLARTTRHLSLTEQGRDYYERCARILSDLDEAHAAIAEASHAPRGLVRVVMPISFSRVTVVPALPSFYERYPEVTIEIVSTDRVVDIVEEGYDLSISGRVGLEAPRSLVSRSLTHSSFITVAAPSYLDANGTPQTPDDLLQHNCILNRGSPWTYCYESGERRTIPVRGNLKVWSGDVVREAAVAGLGIANSTHWLFRKDLERGLVVPVLARYDNEGPPISLFYPANPYMPARVRCFIDFLVEVMGTPQTNAPAAPPSAQPARKRKGRKTAR
jgi:DNA-binding transcriptional LysR family regulator